MIELQDIFIKYIDEYRKKHKLSHVQEKAIRAIINCRTSVLGAHVETCDECGHERISYNSCRNRNCPKCQTFAKEEWIEKQKQGLLNIEYFHAVFTVPDDLNPIFFRNQNDMYNLLFKAVSETIMELCDSKKYLGAKPGITCVLHTWGQNLSYHPHLHCIITGGGLSNSNKWVNSKKKFFIPVKVLSKKFKGKFLFFLRKYIVKNESFFVESNPKKLISDLYKKNWVVYCKKPFADAGKVVEYLGRYTHRVAMSNNRILSIENNQVTFRWRDYKDNNKIKVMTLTADEFIRRFLMHILPSGFRKIRYYGITSSRGKKKRLLLCKWLTRTKIINIKTKLEMLVSIFGKDWNLCPCCKSGHMCRGSPVSVI